MSTQLGFENTDTILVEDRVFAPSSDVVNNANITAYMMTNRLAKGLQNLGVKKGDRVAIYLPLIPEIVAAEPSNSSK